MSNEFYEELQKFGKAISEIKKAYAREYHGRYDAIQIIINDDDFISIIQTNQHGDYAEFIREWVDTKGETIND